MLKIAENILKFSADTKKYPNKKIQTFHQGKNSSKNKYQ